MAESLAIMRPARQQHTLFLGGWQQEITPTERVRGEAIRVAVLSLLSSATARVAMPVPLLRINATGEEGVDHAG